MMSIGEELNEFGMCFNDRLSETNLKFALNYIGLSEVPLALETLCDYLCEGDVPVTEEEYKRIAYFDQALKYPLNKRVMRYLQDLIL